MGIWCCSRRQRQRSDEEAPLIAPETSTDALPPPRPALQKAVDFLSALNANKLPSQNGISQWVQLLLKSDIFRESDDISSGPINHDMRNTLGAQRELLQSVLELGLQSNCTSSLTPQRVS
jgi:hypothetical protein